MISVGYCIIIVLIRHKCSVGIATRYGLKDLGIESRWGRDFPHLSRPTMGLSQPLIQWVPGLFPGSKGAVA
jgi:hypothetical protein